METTQTTQTIAEVAERTGLSKDTLRWYEREGLIPGPGRDRNGYRAYDDRVVALIELVVRLRRTGMPVREAREFVALAREGAATHGRRMALLTAHRQQVLTQLAQLQDDLHAVEAKIDHYAELIAHGRDCDAVELTDPALRAAQRSLQ